MKKIAWTLSAAMLMSGLTACNMDNNEAADNNNATMPIGYYSNHDNGNNRPNSVNKNNGMLSVNYENNRNIGMGNLDNDTEGPLTNMMDQDDNYHPRNDPRNYNRRGLTDHQNDYQRNVNYYDGTDTELSERLTKRIKRLDNIDDANTLVYGNRVIIAVDTNDQNNRDVEQTVRKAVNQLVQGRNLAVVTDENIFSRIDDVNNGLRNGENINKEDTANINNIFADIFNDSNKDGQRPFQDNQ